MGLSDTEIGRTSQQWEEPAILELEPGDLAAVASLFEAPHLKFVVDALVAASSHGRMWVDHPSSPASAFLWDNGPRYYFAGREDNEAFNEAVGRVILEQIAPAPGSYLVVYYSSGNWAEKLPGVLSGLCLHKAQRCLYELRSLNIPDWRQRIPQGFSVAPIDRQLLSRPDLANLGELIDEIQSTWPSTERFLASGFGFCALHNDDGIVCRCTGEYASAHQIGIGIETLERHRRQGLATLVASAFAEHCLSKGIGAHWDCWASNTPSVRVAENVGFQKVLDYDVYEG